MATLCWHTCANLLGTSGNATYARCATIAALPAARCSTPSADAHLNAQAHAHTHFHRHTYTHRFDVNGGRRCGRDFYFRTLQWRIKFFLMPARVWKTKTIIRQSQQQQEQQQHRKQSQSNSNKIEENQKIKARRTSAKEKPRQGKARAEEAKKRETMKFLRFASFA